MLVSARAPGLWWASLWVRSARPDMHIPKWGGWRICRFWSVLPHSHHPSSADTSWTPSGYSCQQCLLCGCSTSGRYWRWLRAIWQRSPIGDVLSIDDYGVYLGGFLCRGEHKFQRFLSIKFHVIVSGPQCCVVCIRLHCWRVCFVRGSAAGSVVNINEVLGTRRGEVTQVHNEWQGTKEGSLRGLPIESQQGGILVSYPHPLLSRKLPPTESV